MNTLIVGIIIGLMLGFAISIVLVVYQPIPLRIREKAQRIIAVKNMKAMAVMLEFAGYCDLFPEGSLDEAHSAQAVMDDGNTTFACFHKEIDDDRQNTCFLVCRQPEEMARRFAQKLSSEGFSARMCGRYSQFGNYWLVETDALVSEVIAFRKPFKKKMFSRKVQTHRVIDDIFRRKGLSPK